MIEEFGGMVTRIPGGMPTLEFEAIYDCVDLFYQAVDRPELLSTSLSMLARVIEVEHVVLIASSGGERRLLSEGHADPRSPVQQVRSTSGAYRTLAGTRTVPLSAGYELVVGSEELEPLAIAGLLRMTPHLSRALRLADRLVRHGQAAGLSSGALDRLGLGVVLLDSEGVVVGVNRVARTVISSSSLIGLIEGRVVPSQSVPRTLLETLVERVLAPGASPRRLSGGQLELRAPGRATIRIIVAPYRARLDHCEAACAILLSSPGTTLEPEELFMIHHQLTSDEAQVATLLVAGRDPIAALGEIHPQLVRTHQERVFAKLSSTRQSDLVRILLRPAGVLFDPVGAGQS